MKLISRSMAVSVLSVLLGACISHKPTPTDKNKAATVTPESQSQPRSQPQTNPNMLYFPPLPDQRSVEDVLQSYGPYASLKLAPYFARAKVSYPPKEVVFVGLKQEKKLEVWAKDSGDFRFIREYDIQAASGAAGPKLRQGDKQVPEGIYRIEGLNPNSRFHLSMKINYPNEFDLLHAWQEGRTHPGSDIFIHGKDRSVGCLAMGDEAIEELFVLTAHVGTEHVKVVIAPRDPRVFPVAADYGELPPWTAELYANISREIKTLSLVVKTVETGL